MRTLPHKSPMHIGYLPYWSRKLLGLFGLTCVLFALPHLMPHSLLSLYESWPVNQQQRPRLIQDYGFDRTLPAQYGLWVQRLFTGQWGTSRYAHRPVLQECWTAAGHSVLLLTWTGGLTILSLLLAARVAPVCRRVSLQPWLGVFGAIPCFLVAVVLRELAVWQFGWLSTAPVTPLALASVFNPYPVILPAAVLMLIPLRAWQHRRAVSCATGRDTPWSYLRTFGRCFRPHLDGFVLEWCLIEYVFAFPGLGRLGIEALTRRDIPLLQGMIVCISLVYFLADGLCERGSRVETGREAAAPAVSAPAPVVPGCRAYEAIWGVCLLGGVTIGAPWLVPYDPMAIHARDQFLAPGYRYLLGTDFLGRDIMSRTLQGFWSTIPRVLALAVVLGSFSWCVAGSRHGVRGLLRRAWGTGHLLFQALPSFLLACLLFLVFEQRSWAVHIALVLACIPLAFQRLPDSARLGQRTSQLAQLSERLLLLEVTFYFLNLSAESFNPTWGSDIRHGMRYGHINIWMLAVPMVAVTWSRYTLARLRALCA